MPCFYFYNQNGESCMAEADPLRPETWPYKREEICRVWSDCTDMFLQCPQSGAGSHESKRFRELLDYIAHNYREKITLQSALSIMGMSKSCFCEFFRKETAMTLITYINKVRIEQAARLLLETDLSCESIGYDCGFTSPSQFYKLFKDFYRYSPDSYRKKGK